MKQILITITIALAFTVYISYASKAMEVKHYEFNQ